MAGIYVHIPFCSSFCIYCDFYSELKACGTDGYVRALVREAQSEKHFFDNTGVLPSTLYVGGGTPSLLPAGQVAELAEAVRGIFGVGTFEEYTLEANPDDVTPEKLSAWRSAGVNRLSMGVQSFRDDHLRWMRRRHDAAGARKAFSMAREAGFGNVSIDLIFGFAGLSPEQWDESISAAMELHPEHISCYQMSIESGSALGALAAAGKYCEPPQEVCAEQYGHLQRRLAEAGYRQYEVSNFALPGFESRHNSAYWTRGPYLGLGAAAHSFDGIRTRRWNEASLEKYLALWGGEDRPAGEPSGCRMPVASDGGRISAGDACRQSESLSPEDAFNETVMLSLRRAAGLSFASLDPSLLASIRPQIDALLAAGLLESLPDCSGVRIPADKWFVSDDITGKLFV